mmetsp:Transcript_49844/g.118152  ORF Transcript_49844/g.118152 Transcript_49844/m.118152 type:complete len:319 (+) Transcript_49844:17-973(+)
MVEGGTERGQLHSGDLLVCGSDRHRCESTGRAAVQGASAAGQHQEAPRAREQAVGCAGPCRRHRPLAPRRLLGCRQLCGGHCHVLLHLRVRGHGAAVRGWAGDRLDQPRVLQTRRQSQNCQGDHQGGDLQPLFASLQHRPWLPRRGLCTAGYQNAHCREQGVEAGRQGDDAEDRAELGAVYDGADRAAVPAVLDLRRHCQHREPHGLQRAALHDPRALHPPLSLLARPPLRRHRPAHAPLPRSGPRAVRAWSHRDQRQGGHGDPRGLGLQAAHPSLGHLGRHAAAARRPAAVGVRPGEGEGGECGGRSLFFCSEGDGA